MFRSREIRWFFTEDCKPISKWFSNKGLTFSKTKLRTDYYLPIKDKEDITVKLREGNIETKQRMGNPEEGNFSEYASGYYEEWIKWSFDVEDDDALSKAIIVEKKYNWIDIQKERVGVKLTGDQNKKPLIVSINDRIPFGCQIEYTRLLIKNKEWFTFAIEWFGDDYLKLDANLISEILVDTPLSKEMSMGYGKFFMGMHQI